MASKKYAAVAVLLLLLVGGGYGVVVLRGFGDASSGDDGAGGEAAAAPAGGAAKARAPGRTSRSNRPAGDGDGDAHAAPGVVPGVSAQESAKPADVGPAGASDRFAPERLDGSVVDSDTGKPLTGVRVLYAIVQGSHCIGWEGDTTEDAGTFTNKRPKGWDADGVRLELRIGKEGYETVRLPISEEAPVVKLRRRDPPALPGRIVGVARTADGKPLSGMVLIDGYDEMGGNASQYAIADAGGAFTLEGVPAGYWQFFESGSCVEAVVPESGEAHVELHPAPVATQPSEADLEKEAQGLQALLADLPADAPNREDAQLHMALARQNQRLAHIAAQPVREVVVTGLGTGPGAALRAEAKPRLYWRTDVRSGEARFAALPSGTWTLVLAVPGRPSVSMPVDIPPGDGPLKIELAAK